VNFRLTLVLLVVLVLLSGAVYYVQSNPATPTPSAQTVAVLSFLPSDVTQLETTGQGKTVVVTHGDDGKWQLKQPEEAPADQIRVDSLVSRLSTLTATRTIDAPASLAEFGLDQPKVQAKLTLKSGQTHTLLVGDQNPDKTTYYAKLPDRQTVYLIPVAVGGDLAGLLTDPPKATPTPTPFPTALAPSGTPTPAGTPAASGSPTATAPAASPQPAPTPTAIVPPALTPPTPVASPTP
jgi:hypothetical protein